MSEMIGTRIDKSIAELIDTLASEQNSDRSKIVRDILTEGVKNRIINLAITQYRNKKISLSRAAEIARVCLADFMQILSENNVPLNYSKDSLEFDFQRTLR